MLYFANLSHKIAKRLLLKLPQRLIKNLHKAPNLRVRVIQRHWRNTNNTRLPLVRHNARLLQHIRHGIESSVGKQDAQLRTSCIWIRRRDDTEAALVVRTGVQESLEVGGQLDGLGADVGHGGLVEDGEGAAEGGELDGGASGDLVAACSWTGAEVYLFC